MKAHGISWDGEMPHDLLLEMYDAHWYVRDSSTSYCKGLSST